MNEGVKFPVMHPIMVPVDQISANGYNPNQMAQNERKLLERSISEDGFTQPIVCYYDKIKDIYLIVDGFHRYTVGKTKFKLSHLPVVLIEKEIENRMASTIRHNRARGVHQIDKLASIVLMLSNKGWSDKKISDHLGMETEEIMRLKQSTGLKEAFINHEFSKSWDVFEAKYYPNT